MRCRCKNEAESLPNTVREKSFKYIHYLDIRHKIIQTLGRKHRKKHHDIEFGIFLGYDTTDTGNKIKIRKIRFVNIKTILETEALSVE